MRTTLAKPDRAAATGHPDRAAQIARLRSFATTYRTALDQLRYRDVTALQHGPHGTAGHGAVGIAHALWRLGVRENDSRLLARAADWLRAAQTDGHGLTPPDWMVRAPRWSLFAGGAGHPVVDALVAATREDRGRLDRALRRFRRQVSAAIGAGDMDLLGGVAGLLIGAAALVADGGITRAQADGQALFAALAGAKDRTLGPAVSFAHGWPGVLHAAIVWCRVSGAPLPPWLRDRLEALAARGSRALVVARHGSVHAPLAPSWCNGATGHVLLFAAAHAATGSEAYRRAARDAAALVAGGRIESDEDGTLCCGTGGRAYAMAVMARTDPAGHWRARALAFAVRSVELRTRNPSGLLWGYSGILCLVNDLLSGRAAFPLLEPDRLAAG